jgi:hypothetical protein
MTSVVLTCLLGLATPLAVQQTPPPAAPTMAPAPSRQGQQGQGQGQQGQQTPQGRGARGGTPPPTAAPEAPTKLSAVHFDSPSLQNIRIEVSMTDTLPTEGPQKKTVTMMVVDNNSGQIRSMGPGNYSLSVDASPHLRPDNKIYLALTIFYVPEPSGQPGQQVRTPANLNEAVSVILADGKPMMISQSADPRGDRRVTVEVTATVVK